ncbi:MAG: N-acetylmuramoyl-L-alanine amidase [Roseiflexaceae bacterium]
MRSNLPHGWTISLLAVPITLGVALLHGPGSVAAPPTPPAKAVAAIARAKDQTAPAAKRSTATPTATAVPPPTNTPTPSAVSTPTARPADTPKRVGIQVGHWQAKDLPDELARLRTSSGAFAAGHAEAQINLEIAKRVVELLQSYGMAADLLPATIPPGYDADAFVSIHADGASSGSSRGFKLATPWRTSRASQHLADTLTDEYAKMTKLPQDGAITVNMRGYYAFNYRRHTHAIAKTTPAVIIETGFLTSAADRTMIVGHPDTVANGIANGIIRYLNEHDPNDGGSLLPPEFKTQRPLDPAGLDVRAAPSDKAKLLKHIDADGRLFVFQERDGWYQVFVRGESRAIGWVRMDQVTTTDDPPPAPPPETDS